MLKRIICTIIFLIIWPAALQFAATNATFDAPLEKMSQAEGITKWQGPYDWKYVSRQMDWSAFPPRMLLTGAIDKREFTLNADFIEWMYSGRSQRHQVKKGRVFDTGMAQHPFVTEWDIAQDQSMRFSIGGFRFNWHFMMALFMALVLPPLYLMWMIADDMRIITPAERKKRDDDFVNLVKLIEAKAKADPAWLKKRTVRLALVGYAVVFGAILLMIPIGLGLGAAVLLLTGANAGAAKLAFVLAAVPIGFSFIMAKSMLLPNFPPPGLEIREQDAPQLFAFLSRIIEKAQGPRFAGVYISNEMNASVSRNTGFLGFFGFGPVVLTLGLPLMQALTLPQLASVVGHEYGHVAAKDNALGQWIYRIRTSWLILGDRLQFEHMWYALKLNRFYNWFIGVFSAYSFALSRRCEYEADAFAAKLAGADHAAAALSAVAVRDHETATLYWRDQWKKAEATPDPAGEAPYTAMAGFFGETRDQKDIIDIVTKEEPGYASTHPTLMERVRALGHGFIAPQPVASSAARELLGAAEQKLAGVFNAEWLEAAKPHWQAAHTAHLHVTARYAELKQKNLPELTREELDEVIAAADRAKDDAAIIAACEEILRREPDNNVAQMNIAGIKLDGGDESQLAVLQMLAKKDPQALPSASRHAIAYFYKHNRKDEAKPWEEKLTTWDYERQAGAEEREIVLATDSYLPHGLPADAVKVLAAHCANHKLLHSVYIVQKKVQYLPEYPSYLVAFKMKQSMFSTQKKLQAELTEFIGKSNLGEAFLFINVNSISGLEGKMKKMPDACVYSIKKVKAA
ncbi:MAG: M48 family metallopeptidase [bacterium]|nr:M48 family metallopeptidase [bacterium]